MIHIGIDPGKDGALVCIFPDGTISKSVVPTIGKEYDKKAMLNLLLDIYEQSNGNCHLCLENINGHSAMGRTGAFVMGIGKGLWEMAIMAVGIPHTFVTPQSWQKEVWKGIPIQYKAGTKVKTKDTKATSLISAQRLFPKVDLRKSDKCKNPHQGIVDALLLAEYSRRNFGF